MSTITREFTKEQLIEHIKGRKEFADECAADSTLHPERREYYELTAEALRIALASLEAEPVMYVMAGECLEDDATSTSKAVVDAWVEEWDQVGEQGYRTVPLYAAPPAPVSDEDLLQMAASAIDDLLSNKDRSGAGVWADIPAKLRRAAMLQGDEPVTTDYKLPGWVACSERMPVRDYVLAADFSGKQYPANMPNIQIGIYADWFYDGCPCWDDGDGNDLHLKQVTHWAQIPAAPQQEVKP